MLIFDHSCHRSAASEPRPKETAFQPLICSKAVGQPILAAAIFQAAHESHDKIQPMDAPQQVIFIAIEPKTMSDREKLAQGLPTLMAEDPTFLIDSDARTGQTIVRGMVAPGPHTDDEDRMAPVVVPRTPAPKGKGSGVALPDPENGSVPA
jgi:hypothetical protein